MKTITDDRIREWHTCPKCDYLWLNRNWDESVARRCLALGFCPWCAMEAPPDHPTPTNCDEELRTEGEL